MRVKEDERYQTFVDLIQNISRSVQKIKNEEMAIFGLRGNQVQCIFTLYRTEKGASLTELCELCNEDKGAMSRTIKELSERKLVYTAEKSTQRYKNPIKLTEAGYAFAEFVSNRIGSITKLAGLGMSGQERQDMYSALTHISENLTRICENYDKNEDEAEEKAEIADSGKKSTN